MGVRNRSHGQSSLHPGTPPKISSDHDRAIARSASEYSTGPQHPSPVSSAKADQRTTLFPGNRRRAVTR
jgi:hypothetical protein